MTLLRSFQTGGVTPPAPVPAMTIEQMRSLDPAKFSQLSPADQYKVQNDTYKSWQTSYRNPDQFSYKLSPAELTAWQKQQGANLVYNPPVKELWVGKNTDGTPNYDATFPVYSRPVQPAASSATTSTPSTPSASATNMTPVATAPKEFFYTDPYTNQPLDPKIYGRPEGAQMNVQLAQGVDKIALANKVKNAAAAEQQAAQRAQNIEALKQLTPEQQADMRAKGMTPTAYLNNLTVAAHRKGGVLRFQTGGTTPATPAAEAPARPEYQLKSYNGRSYDKLGLNERRILDYRYGYTGVELPDGTIQYEKWPEGTGVGQNYYGQSTVDLNRKQKENGVGTYGTGNKWAYMKDPESNTMWFINNGYLGPYTKAANVPSHRRGGLMLAKPMKKKKKGGLLY